jgi:aspartate-semialdehyde dehydrogenase
MSTGYRVAVVGATGVVGQTVLQVLTERQFPVSELVPFASERSDGKPIRFRGEELRCRALALDAIGGFDLVFSSAGGDVSREWMPRFADQGAIVIDKSSVHRMKPEVPLVVPEVNPEALRDVGPGKIISSPNCSTTQMVVALKPLHDEAVIKRLVIATYQAVSGTGRRALEELRAQSRTILDGEPIAPPQVYPHQIAFNVLPQAGSFVRDESYTDEEVKLRQETHKIFREQGGEGIRISATCVRVPVANCHSEAVNVEFNEPLAPERAHALLEAAPGVVVIDEPDAALYPLAIDATGHDEVFVGRIRRGDPDQKCVLDLWIVADNLRKGAATNAVQIAKLLHDQGQITRSRRLVAA